MLNKAGYKSGVNDTGIFMELGGASINANASGGYVAPVTPTAAPSTEPTSSSCCAGGSSTSVSPPGDFSSAPVPSSPVPTPELAAKPLALPGALSSWWIVFGVALALLVSYLLSLLPVRAFAAGAASCRLEEDS